MGQERLATLRMVQGAVPGARPRFQRRDWRLGVRAGSQASGLILVARVMPASTTGCVRRRAPRRVSDQIGCRPSMGARLVDPSAPLLRGPGFHSAPGGRRLRVMGATCQACGQENRAGRKYCAACGARLALSCPACGTENEPGERFCGECGTVLSREGAVGPAPARTGALAPPAREARGERKQAHSARAIAATSSPPGCHARPWKIRLSQLLRRRAPRRLSQRFGHRSSAGAAVARGFHRPHWLEARQVSSRAGIAVAVAPNSPHDRASLRGRDDPLHRPGGIDRARVAGWR